MLNGSSRKAIDNEVLDRSVKCVYSVSRGWESVGKRIERRAVQGRIRVRRLVGQASRSEAWSRETIEKITCLALKVGRVETLVDAGAASNTGWWEGDIRER